MYYSWSKEFLEAGKRRLAGDTARAATTDEVKQLRREAQDLKEVVAEQALERGQRDAAFDRYILALQSLFSVPTRFPFILIMPQADTERAQRLPCS